MSWVLVCYKDLWEVRLGQATQCRGWKASFSKERIYFLPYKWIPLYGQKGYTQKTLLAWGTKLSCCSSDLSQRKPDLALSASILPPSLHSPIQTWPRNKSRSVMKPWKLALSRYTKRWCIGWTSSNRCTTSTQCLLHSITSLHSPLPQANHL